MSRNSIIQLITFINTNKMNTSYFKLGSTMRNSNPNNQKGKIFRMESPVKKLNFEKRNSAHVPENEYFKFG